MNLWIRYFKYLLHKNEDRESIEKSNANFRIIFILLHFLVYPIVFPKVQNKSSFFCDIHLYLIAKP